VVRPAPICRQHRFGRVSTTRESHAQLARRTISDPGDCYCGDPAGIECLLRELREHADFCNELSTRVALLEAHKEFDREARYSRMRWTQNFLKAVGIAAGITLGVLSFFR